MHYLRSAQVTLGHRKHSPRPKCSGVRGFSFCYIAMSIKLMTKVWENGPDDRTETMVLLALADRANDDGSSCFPSMAEIAQRSRLSRRGAQKVVRRLDDNGYLTIQENEGPGGVNNYQIHPGELSGRTEFTGGEPDSPPGEHASRGGERDDEKGRTSFARNRQEPSYNHQSNQQSAPAREDPAVKAYHEIMPRRANNVQQDMMRQQVEDMDTWKEVLREWRGNGWSPQSVTKMIDRYQNQNGQADGATTESTDDVDDRWDLAANG